MEHSTRGVAKPVARVSCALELMLLGRPIRTARVRPVGEVPRCTRSAEVRGHVVHMTKFYRCEVIVTAVSGMRSVVPSCQLTCRLRLSLRSLAAPLSIPTPCSPSYFCSLLADRSAACRRYANHISACAHGFRRLPSVPTSPLL